MRPRALAAEIGAKLHAFRVARGLRQDDVARSARHAGLSWTRMVVRTLEAGRRELSIDEYAVLQVILERLGAGPSSVLLESGPDIVRLQVPALHLAHESLVTRGPELPNPYAELVARCRAWWPNARFLHVEAAYAAAGRELEQRLARQIQMDPVVVALVALKTWGRSLSEERDHRIAAQVGPGVEARALQALRGHVTRTLRTELGSRLAEARKHFPRKKGNAPMTVRPRALELRRAPKRKASRRRETPLR
jgi:hypothetical protein